MRLIDADMIISELSPVRETVLGIAFINVLETAPSVEIIKCKDCDFWSDNYCNFGLDYKTYREADDFCSRAKRRVENDGRAD